MSTLPDVPSALPAERATLGAVLRDPRAIEAIAEWLRPSHCYLLRHEHIYAAMLAAHGRGDPPDRVMVAAELDRAGHLAAVGGEMYLIDLMAEVAHAGHIERHARLVEQTAILRRLIEAGGRLAALGYDALGDDLDEVASRAEGILGDALAGRATREHAATLRAIYSAMADRLGAHAGGGTPTGYPDLDDILGGLQPSDLIILAARPSTGKTALALSLAYRVALFANRDRHGGTTWLPGLNVGIFSMEMSREQLAQRLLAMHTGVDLMRLRTGNLRDDEIAAALDGMAELSEAPISIEDAPALSIRDVQRRARRMHDRAPLGLLIVDYLQLMGGGRAENRVQEVSEISRGLKALARELNVPVLALSQLSRAVEGRQIKVPMLSDLRESGSIEQDADVVLFIYREELYDKETDKKGIAEIHVAKHRNGPLGVAPLRFDARTTQFQPLERYHAPEGYA